MPAKTVKPIADLDSPCVYVFVCVLICVWMRVRVCY